MAINLIPLPLLCSLSQMNMYNIAKTMVQTSLDGFEEYVSNQMKYKATSNSYRKRLE